MYSIQLLDYKGDPMNVACSVRWLPRVGDHMVIERTVYTVNVVTHHLNSQGDATVSVIISEYVA